jgi:hypothetical protein
VSPGHSDPTCSLWPETHRVTRERTEPSPSEGSTFSHASRALHAGNGSPAIRNPPCPLRRCFPSAASMMGGMEADHLLWPPACSPSPGFPIPRRSFDHPSRCARSFPAGRSRQHLLSPPRVIPPLGHPHRITRLLAAPAICGPAARRQWRPPWRRQNQSGQARAHSL